MMKKAASAFPSQFQVPRQSNTTQVQTSRFAADSRLAITLKSLARCSSREELLACRALCTQSPSFATVGLVNKDAAWLAVHLANLSLRNRFDIIERRLCHYSSSWRQGFNRQRRNEQEAAFWICRGISRIIGEVVPRELEALICTYCNSKTWVALESKQLRSLNDLHFHWHRKFSQGSTGPQRAVHLAYKTLGSSGTLILNVAEGISARCERSFDAEGKNITEHVFADALVVRSALTTLAETKSCMGAHPGVFGRPVDSAKAEDQALKEEVADEEARLERWRDLGYYVDEADLDQRM